MKSTPRIVAWRHPRPRGAQGVCIGRTDVPVDPRKAKRLAHRIRHWARRHGAARVVFTSDLRRARSVGRWLAAWGWRHRVDPRLNELDFGTWEGCAWDEIGAAAIDAWCRDFATSAPGGGETVVQLLSRCAAFVEESQAGATMCVVGHAGWISAARWSALGGARLPNAAQWPAPARYAQRVEFG